MYLSKTLIPITHTFHQTHQAPHTHNKITDLTYVPDHIQEPIQEARYVNYHPTSQLSSTLYINMNTHFEQLHTLTKSIRITNSEQLLLRSKIVSIL